MLTDRSVPLRVTVNGPGADGRCAIAVHTLEDDGSWTSHANGTLTAATAPIPPGDPDWPPRGAEEADLLEPYDVLAGAGFEYGQAFQGLTGLWHRADEIFAEVGLPRAAGADAGRFGIHPALSDAALHAIALAGLADGPGGGLGLPFSWSGVSLHRTGATAARVAVSPAGGGHRIRLMDADGNVIMAVDELTTRPVPATDKAARRDSLFTVAWKKIPGDSAHADPVSPDLAVVAIPAPQSSADIREAAHSATQDALLTVQKWLADNRAGSARLVVRTNRAVPVAEDDVVDLTTSAVWGLVRSAQTENPGRIVLLDSDSADVPDETVSAAVASAEPQVAVRAGELWMPRLTRVVPPDHIDRPAVTGTVLITGGTGGLGGVVARHLVVAHSVRDLVLLGRRGPDTPAASELVDELTRLGANARVVACDVADSAALTAVLDEIPPDRPLRGVVHTAGVLDDGLLPAIDADRLANTLRPKVDGGWLLHELTSSADLDFFVLFSSAAGVLGAAGQANYAAANTFLDALAYHRRANGLPAVSLAWGLWNVDSGMAGTLAGAAKGRLARMGALTPAEGLALLDVAIGLDNPVLVAMRLNRPGRGAEIPALMRELVPARRRVAAVTRETRQVDLADMAPAERENALVRLVRGHVAAVLGHVDAADVDPAQDFLAAGFDSLTAVELRNALCADTGLVLPMTVAFDHPSPLALAEHISGLLAAGPSTPAERSSDSDSGALGAMFRGGIRAGKYQPAFDLLVAAADLRASFNAPDELPEPPVPVVLAEGTRPLRLFCVPSPMGLGSGHQYARLAASLRGKYTVSVLPLPGFAAGESLPESAAAVVDVFAGMTSKAADGDPFALVGYSAGGLFAHETAARMRAIGVAPAAVVLLDTFRTFGETGDESMGLMLNGLVDREESIGPFNDSRLSAMGRYVRLMEECSVTTPVDAPVLFVQAETPIGTDAPSSMWPDAYSTKPVPGNHFTFMEEHAATTAEVLENWLESAARKRGI
ncbi:type I polyketide synthase [Kibdelosporangium phytohabitans]|uniref:type I polyketide synthase n=1 Tax=Kibdelosporangium phytohabitans TaxID=860235 RepID=UPI003B846BB4